MAIDEPVAAAERSRTDHPAEALASVLVTGAGGFIGGQIANELAQAGYRVKALTRRDITREAADPRIEWIRGDLCNARDLHEAVKNVQRVVHTAGWVSLKTDRRGESRRVNVEATRDLLDHCAEEGVERLVYTSTLWTGLPSMLGEPDDTRPDWDLRTVLKSAYRETKREAEQLVLERNRPGFQASVICPGMVVGPGDRRPTSTGLLLKMAQSPVVFLPRGGIPIVDVRVVAQAHRRVLELETDAAGQRYVVVGPYLSYHEMARIVRSLTRRPRWIVTIPDRIGPALCRASAVAGHLLGDLAGEITPAAVAGGFLRLHASGTDADTEFGLTHPPALRSIFDALNDHRTSGRASWLPPLQWPTGTLPGSPH
jgi:dihydroflavonol-4-reductase